MTAIKQNHINKLDPFSEQELMSERSEFLNPREAKARSFIKRNTIHRERRALNRLTQEEVTESIVTTQLAFDFKPIRNKQYRVKKTEWVKVGPNEFMPIYPDNRHACIAAIVRNALK